MQAGAPGLEEATYTVGETRPLAGAVQSRGEEGVWGRCPVGVTPCSSKGSPAAAPLELNLCRRGLCLPGVGGGVG